MKEFLLKILILLYFSLMLMGCNKTGTNNTIPNTPSKIYFGILTKNENLYYVDFLTNKIENGESKLMLLRGFLYLSSWENDKALADFQIILKNDNTNSDAYLGMAIYYEIKDSILFRDNINKALEYNPDNSLAYYIRSNHQNSFKEVIKDLNKAIELESDNANYYFWRGVKYDFADSIYLAKKDFNKAIELDSTLIVAYSFLGIGAEYEKQYEDALKNYSLMIKFAPDKHWGYESRGEMYYRIELYNKAIADYKKALQHLTPKFINGKEVFLRKKKHFYYDIAINYCLLHNDSVYNYLELTFKEDTTYVKKAQNDNYFNKIKETKRFKNLIDQFSK